MNLTVQIREKIDVNTNWCRLSNFHADNETNKKRIKQRQNIFGNDFSRLGDFFFSLFPVLHLEKVIFGVS